MKIKVSEATPTQLDWLVAKTQGWVTYPTDSKEQGHWYHTNAAIAPMGYEHNRVHTRDFKPSTDWSKGGPIIECEGISIIRVEDDYGVDSKGYCTNKRIPVWCATTGHHGTNSSCEGWHYDPQYEVPEADTICGPTPLIAAMRCYCCAKLGYEVTIPEELCQQQSS